MGCGSCPKKRLQLDSKPQGIPRERVDELFAYVDHKVRIKDKTGVSTFGLCQDIWIDESETGAFVEIGSVAVKTLTGVSLIGLNIIDSVELASTPQ